MASWSFGNKDINMKDIDRLINVLGHQIKVSNSKVPIHDSTLRLQPSMTIH